MDFIEQWFGLSPDGGTGSLEMLYLAVIVAIILMIVFRSRLLDMLGRSRGDRKRED